MSFRPSLLAILTFLPSLSTAGDLDPTAIDAIVKDALRAWEVPGVAVAIVRGDEVIHLKGYGYKNVETKEKVTPDTIFPIASCTKGFTTTAMAMLVDEGKMAWDDPVRKHVPSFHLSDPLADGQVTLRDLVTHRTGVGSHELLWYRSPWSREEVIRRIGLVKPTHSFRSRFHYQTTMFTVAGVAVEAASKMKWEEFVHKRIFESLKMSRSSFTTSPAEKDPDHASPHRKNGSRAGVIPWYPIDRPEPAGSINSTARDLSNWVRLHVNDGRFGDKELVSAKNLGETHTPQTIIRMEGQARDMNTETTQMSYGMGWVIQDYRGHLQVSHAGAIDGFRAHFTLLPRQKIGIVLLNNLDRTQMNLALSNNLVDFLLGLPIKDWNAYVARQVKKGEEAARQRHEERENNRKPGTRPTLASKEYTGKYEDPAYGVATITLEDGNLVWKWSTFSATLEHYQDDTFTVSHNILGEPLLIFSLDSNGKVAGLTVQEPLGVEFKKTKPRSPAP